MTKISNFTVPTSSLITHPVPTRGPDMVLTGDWETSLANRGWITLAHMNMLGLLYSTKAATGAFKRVGRRQIRERYKMGEAVMRSLVDRKYVTAQIDNALRFDRFMITPVGARTYELLYWAGESGVYPWDEQVKEEPEQLEPLALTERERDALKLLAALSLPQVEVLVRLARVLAEDQVDALTVLANRHLLQPRPKKA